MYKHEVLDLFSFVFPMIEEKYIVINSRPWSFAHHLLVLKPYEASTPPDSMLFDSYAFWMHIHGLPVEGRKEEVIKSIDD